MSETCVLGLMLEAGIKRLLADRDWGDRVAYCLDLDGHVLAFVEKNE